MFHYPVNLRCILLQSRTLILLLGFGFFCFSCESEFTIAQTVKDRVVVTASSPMKLSEKEVGQVYEGEVHTILAVNGNWCALEDVEGWLPLRNVNFLKNGMELFTSRIAKNKNDFAAFSHRAMIHYENGDLDKAFYDLNEALKLSGRNPVIWNNRGKVLLAQNKAPLALIDVQYAVKLNPNFPLAHFNLGRIHHALNDWPNAVAAYDQAIKLDPKLSDFFLNRGTSHLMQGNNAQAEADFEKAIAINGRKGDAYVGLSNLALANDNLEQALSFADKAIKLNPKDPYALSARGWTLHKLGRKDEAVFELTRSIQANPRFSLAFNNRGVCYAESGNYLKAIADYSEALKINPRDSIARSNRGNAWFRMGDFAKAKSDFQAVIEQSPQLLEGLNSYAWFLATCPDETFRDAQVALVTAEAANKLRDGSDWNSLRTLAAALAENGKFDEAIVAAENSLQAAPEKDRAAVEEVIEALNSRTAYRVKVAKPD